MDAIEEKRRAAGYSPEQLIAERAKPQPCHNCEVPYVGVKCRCCGEYRPAYIALKNITRGGV